MSLWKRKLKNEDGSATIEFLGILPLAILFIVILIQIITSINGFLVAQSAVNEYAKVYSITTDHDEAQLAANEMISSADNYITITSITNDALNTGRKEFEATMNFEIDLIFLTDTFSVGPIVEDVVASGRVVE